MNIFAGAGFAVMAWKLVQIRAFPDSLPNLPAPRPRQLAAPFLKASAAYYAILDSASTAFAHAIVMHGWEANTQLKVTL